MRPTIPFAIIATIMLALAATAGAQQTTGKAEVREDKDKIVLENDHISVWFHGKKPFLKIFPAAPLNASDANATADAAFSFKFHQLVEYRDVDDDNLPTNAEILSSLNLEKAGQWTVETSEENGTVTLNLSVEAPVRLAGGLLQDSNVSIPDRTASISILFHISDVEKTVVVGNDTLTVPTNAVKYDLVVNQWPFADPADARLALEAIVSGDLAVDDLLGVEGAAVTGNGTEVGLVAWADTAEGIGTDGESVEVPVLTATSSAEVDGDGIEGASSATRLVHTFDAANLASLVYDPVIGVATVGGAGNPDETSDGGAGGLDVPGPAVILVAATIAGAALVTARRR